MKIKALIQNSINKNEIKLQTNDKTNSINIPVKSSGFGSSVNGGELLFLSLATCYCNDIYREAGYRNIKVVSVEVSVDGEFRAEGDPLNSIIYCAKVTAHANEDAIKELMMHTDKVAEIQNTLRTGIKVSLENIQAVSV